MHEFSDFSRDAHEALGEVLNKSVHSGTVRDRALWTLPFRSPKGGVPKPEPALPRKGESDSGADAGFRYTGLIQDFLEL